MLRRLWQRFRGVNAAVAMNQVRQANLELEQVTHRLSRTADKVSRTTEDLHRSIKPYAAAPDPITAFFELFNNYKAMDSD
jgi:hypothetical protein